MSNKNENVENLTSTEGIKKMKKLVEDADICMFVTQLDQLPLSARPMSSQHVDESGCIYFFSTVSSDKNIHIQKDDRVQLFYSNKNSSEYLSIYGTAVITKDIIKIKEYWSTMVKAWFPEGPDDPDISLITVTPLDGYYWDTKHNKYVALFKIATSIITGKTMDDSVEGELNV